MAHYPQTAQSVTIGSTPGYMPVQEAQPAVRPRLDVLAAAREKSLVELQGLINRAEKIGDRMFGTTPVNEQTSPPKDCSDSALDRLDEQSRVYDQVIRRLGQMIERLELL